MTLLEFILSVAVVGMVALECITLLELRNLHHTLAAQGSQRRQWNKQEHRVD